MKPRLPIEPTISAAMDKFEIFCVIHWLNAEISNCEKHAYGMRLLVKARIDGWQRFLIYAISADRRIRLLSERVQQLRKLCA